jgi:hypothetical protein
MIGDLRPVSFLTTGAAIAVMILAFVVGFVLILLGRLVEVGMGFVLNLVFGKLISKIGGIREESQGNC